jgi:hypothetical protein
MERFREPNIAHHEPGNFLKKTELLFSMFEPGFQLFDAGHRTSLSQIWTSRMHLLSNLNYFATPDRTQNS